MDSVWIKSALVEPLRILGVQLRPFSAWHALILTAFDSPFVCGGEPVIGDLVMALLVCRDGYADKLRHLLAFQRAGLTKACYAVRWLFSDWHRAADDFAAYLEAFQAGPGYWPSNNAKHSRVLPPFKIVTTLLSHMGGLTLAEAWDMPLCLANCFQASIAEDNGMEIQGEDEIRKAMDAERLFEEAAAIAREAGAHGDN